MKLPDRKRPVRHEFGHGRKFRYIALTCGHFTTPELQELFSVWRPEAGQYLCQVHNEWVPGEPKKDMPPQPEDPPF